MSFSRACVTGGAGFIGSRLAAALLERGLEVVVLDNLSVGRASSVPAGAELVEGDVTACADAARAVSGCDVVFHLAARVAIRSSFEFVHEDTLTNATGTAAMLREARECGSVRRFISTSSMAVYADAPSAEPIAETHPTLPISPYGISKLAAERLTHAVCANAGMGSAVLRLFNTYGPGQTLSPYVGVVTIFVSKILAGDKPEIFGDGEQCRDFVHVDDVVEGFLGAMDAPSSGGTYNIGSGVPQTVNQVYAALARVLESDMQPRHVAAAEGELRYSVADVSRACDELGFCPGHRFPDSIAEVVREIQHGERG